MKINRHTLHKGELNHELLWSILGIVSALILMLWVRFLKIPDTGCVFHNLTGYPCLSCGFTRSILSMMHGNLLHAISMNPLCVAVAGLWLLYIPYGLLAHFAVIPRIRFTLSARDMFVVRIAVVLTAGVVWAWLIFDGR